jgi:hypothetical protein
VSRHRSERHRIAEWIFFQVMMFSGINLSSYRLLWFLLQPALGGLGGGYRDVFRDAVARFFYPRSVPSKQQ